MFLSKGFINLLQKNIETREKAEDDRLLSFLFTHSFKVLAKVRTRMLFFPEVGNKRQGHWET